MRQTRGFTLVELLVVVGIISMLAALLLPSLQQALESSRDTHCLNNVKQNHLALRMYADDFKGYTPSSGYGSWSNFAYIGWYYLLATNGYLDATFAAGTQNFSGPNPPSSYCPSYPLKGIKHWGYSLRAQNKFVCWDAYPIKSANWNFAGGFSITIQRYSKAYTPAKFMILGDGVYYYTTRPPMTQHFNLWDQSKYNAATNGYGAIHSRHQNMSAANMFFLDGHGRSVPTPEVLTQLSCIDKTENFTY